MTERVHIVDGVPTPDPDAAYPFADQFDAVVLSRGDSTALGDADGFLLTYCELERLSRHIAAEVLDDIDGSTRADDVSGPAPVGVMGTSATAISAMVAVLRAGRPLVIVDPALPEGRLADIMGRAGVRRVFADPDCLSTLENSGLDQIGVAVTPLSRTWAEEALLTEPAITPAELDRLPGTGCDDPASIVYTSGSTGAPKGVALSHGAIVNGARLSKKHFELTANDVCALALPAAYAAGQEIIFAAILNGCRLESRDVRRHPVEGFADWLHARQISTLHATPSMARRLTGLLAAQQFEEIRVLTTCGEAIHGRDVAACASWLPAARYVNYVGSSETGHMSFFHAESLAGVPTDAMIPAGEVVDGKEIDVYSEAGEPLPVGEIGRLHISGRHIALGYWNDPISTAAVFGLDRTLRGFTSGDRGQRTPTGELILRGRRDDAVKIRGYLVEPAEVEAALRSLEVIADAAVIADMRDEPTLIGYIVPATGQRNPSKAQVRAQLREIVPEQMVPPRLMLLGELPRNERGKLDRSALPQPLQRTGEPPRDEWEQVVARHWTQILGLDEVFREEDFFALGGDSLSAMTFVAAMSAEGVAMTHTDLAGASTVARCAAVLRERASQTPTKRHSWRQHFHRSRYVVPVRADGDDIPVFCFAGAGGPAYLFSSLVAELPVTHPVTIFQVRGFDGVALPDWSVARAARRYVGAVCASRPSGPVMLIGHSLGGLFALEVAHQLRARGRAVPLLVMLDTVLPGWLATTVGEEAPAVRIAGFERQSRKDLWLTRARLLGAGWFPYRQAMRDEVFFQHGLRLTERYRPSQPWDGATEVFLTNENIDGRHWWGRVLSGDYRLSELPCDHVGVLKSPWVERVMDQVRERLAEVVGNGSVRA